MKCVFCDVELNKDNDSLEHIIPNSLGGKLKSKILYVRVVIIL